jgi:putative tryptophan/tyrosine transport system substrate-binding protein
MRLIGLAVALAVGLTLAPLAVEAQQAGKPARIGFLSLRAEPTARDEPFRERLRELGYVEGQNLVTEFRWAAGRNDQLQKLAEELVRLNVEVIVSTGTPPSHAARRATRTIPIVFVGVGDPVGTGLVASLAKPGGNVTGGSISAPGLYAKRLQLLREAVPTAKSIVVLHNPLNANVQIQLQDIESAARNLGVELVLQEASSVATVDGAFHAIRVRRPDALFVADDPVLLDKRRQIVELAEKMKLPALYGFKEYVEAGGLISYGANNRENYRAGADYVHRILRGAKPQDLPVSQATLFELYINSRTARALGLTIPQTLLLRADQVIQ